MLETFAEEFLRYNSPLAASHSTCVPTWVHFLEGAGVVELVDEVEPEAVTNRIAIALLFAFVLEHGVLKWLQNPLLKYVILKQAISSWHVFLHWSRLGSFLGDSFRYSSPLLVSHSKLNPISTHVRVAPAKS